MSERIQIGILGAGMWAKTHVETIREEGRGEVAWVYSRTEATARELQAQTGIPRVTTDHREVLADPAVRAVIVTTPPFTHEALAIDALRAGKHLLLEKPMAVSDAEAARIEAEAARHPEVVALEASCRFFRVEPMYPFVRDMVAGGKIGEVYHIDFIDLKTNTFVEYNRKAAAWGARKKFAGGGPFMDWGGYDLSAILGALDDRPKLAACRAFTKNGLRSAAAAGEGADVEQHGGAFLEFEGGLTMWYERGGGAYGNVPGRVRLHGTKGGLAFSYYPWDAQEVRWFHEGPEGKIVEEILPVPQPRRWSNANTPVIAHFLDCVEGKAKPCMPLALARKNLQIVLKILG